MATIFNKSSENMSAVRDQSVDLLYAGPPYNIGTRYGKYADALPLKRYQELMRVVFGECRRVLKEDGLLILECADSILVDGAYIQLAGYLQYRCLQWNFSLMTRHINFARSAAGIELPEERFGNDYVANGNAHSNCHQLLVFAKTSGETLFEPNGRILYHDYVPVPGHPCPTPDGLVRFVLDTYFKPDMTVLDPFMGTAAIGVEVEKRGGMFIGYERDPSIFAIAEKALG